MTEPSVDSLAEIAAALKDATVSGINVQVLLTVRHQMAGDVEAELRGVKRAAFDAAPGPDEPAVTLRRLARLAKWKHGSYFRTAVRELVDDGFLVRVSGGVRKAWQMTGQTPATKRPK
jgi:hypothetical protein